LIKSGIVLELFFFSDFKWVLRRCYLKISCALCPKLKYCVSDFFQKLLMMYFKDKESIRALMLALGEEKDKIVGILVYEIYRNSVVSKKMKEEILYQYQNLYGEK